MNLVVLTGRLTRDPELKYGQSGMAYCRISLAVNRARKRDEVDFINCVAFGKTAELIGEYFRKGSRIGVEGNLQMNRYEVNGEKRTSYDVAINQIEFLDSKGSSQNNSFDDDHGYSAPSRPQQPSSPAPSAPAPAAADFDDDDEFPF